MNEKIKALGEWYLELYENDNGFSFNGSNITGYETPNLRSVLSLYKINPPKPKLKIIDLSMMVGSDIDMEFSNFKFSGQCFVGKLINAEQDMYLDDYDEYDFCRVRQSSWHSWQGNECPIPEGLMIKYKYYRENIIISNSSDERIQWHQVIAFMVTGKQDGYIYEWEQE